jgi:hypothetical protein
VRGCYSVSLLVVSAAPSLPSTAALVSSFPLVFPPADWPFVPPPVVVPTGSTFAPEVTAPLTVVPLPPLALTEITPQIR